MRMLQWMCRVTGKDKIRNEHIQGTTKVAQASKKITERRLNWYGHVMRRDEEHILRKVLRTDNPGKRKRGRPKMRLEKYWAEGGRGDRQSDVEKGDLQSYQRPYMVGGNEEAFKTWFHRRYLPNNVGTHLQLNILREIGVNEIA